MRHPSPAARIRDFDLSAFEDARTLPSAPAPGAVWFLVGLPGAGKSTLARHVPAAHVVSIDAIREEIGAPPADKARFLDEAYAILHDRMEMTLASGHAVVVDTSGLYTPAREEVRELARRLARPLRFLYLATDPETAARRQAAEHPEREPFLWMEHALALLLEDLALDLHPYAVVHALGEEAQDELIRRWTSAPAP